jgi:hypothetical protein
MQLRTPRHHHEYLHRKGKLDEFVEAKVQGKEAVAKWNLLTTASKEIENIEK